MNVEQLRAFVLTLDGAQEASHQGNPDFRFDNRIVVNLNEAARSITIKLPLDDQAALVQRDDQAFSLPGGWAKHGWTTISLDLVDDEEIRELIVQAWDDTRSR